MPEVNLYAMIILGALLAEWALHLTAELLNLGALRRELPEEFHDVVDAQTYRRSQDYTRAGTRFGWLETTVNLALLLLFWFLGGFAWLDRWLSSFALGPIWTGLAFIGSLMLAHALVNLPFHMYATFVIEAGFGFNRMTQGTFWADRAKGLLLSIVLGAPLLAVILWVFENAGTFAWLYCWVAASACVLAVQCIAPTWILPLFNAFRALKEGELRDAILAYGRSVDFPLAGIFVIDGSKRSTKANAFFTGFGKRKRVVLFDTLVEKHPTSELVAVVAHEVGHYQKGHILKRLGFIVAHLGVIFALVAFFLSCEGLFAAFGLTRPSVHTGLVFFGLLYTPIELVLSVVLHASSRRDEYEADRFAARTTGNPETFASALKRLAAENLANLTPHPFYVTLNDSHPPILARIRALRA